MVNRIPRNMSGGWNWPRPLSRRRFVIPALLACLTSAADAPVRVFVFAGWAVAAQAADSLLPEITSRELATKIREAIRRHDDKGSIRVVFSVTTDTNWTAADQKPVLVSYRGRARYETDGSRWRTEYDSMMPSSRSDRLSTDQWTSGFDGVESYDHQISKNQFILGETNSGARQWTPRGLIWEGGDELIKLLEEPDNGKFPIAIDQRVVDGLRCYVVKRGKAGGEWGAEYVVSARQGYLLTSRTQFRSGKKYVSYDLRGVHEAARGVWTPERIEYDWLNIRDDGTSRRIVDGAGQPLAGTTVRATLQLSVLFTSQPGGKYLTAYRGPVDRFTAGAGPDGRFELSGLCKGEYSLKIDAPSKAWAERKVVIAPDFTSAPLDVVLDQGGSLAGQVRDKQGQPVAAATITLRERHEKEDYRPFASFDSTWPDPVRTDAAGQFGFTGLREGRFTIEVHAAGFKNAKVHKIPAGTENVAVTLER